MRRGIIFWFVHFSLGVVFFVGSEKGAFPSANSMLCLDCHEKINPRIVSTWKDSPMAKEGVSCIDCHGSDHQSDSDAFRVSMAVGQVCQDCHPEEAEGFKSGKHARAWESVYALAAIRALPEELIEGEQGCGGCHAIGRTDGHCDSCHTRHTFSKEEARNPRACLPCHGGVNHPQWEIWKTSKHGVVYEVSRGARGPTCQICHMPKGSHGVETAWSLLALRSTEMDPEWATSRKTILQWLGLVDEAGNPRAQVGVFLSYKEWEERRSRMLEVCGECHSRLFAREKMQEVDRIIMKADKVMADAIRIVEGLYTEKILPRPTEKPPRFPDLLGFHTSANGLEERLLTMFFRNRLIMLHGAFHNNPDFATNDGWVKLKRGYHEIQNMAQELRKAR
jgi:hydroxylamine dehydrogenase